MLAGAPDPPAKTRPIHIVLVAGPKDHGPGEHDYPAWQKAWAELLGRGRQRRGRRPPGSGPTKEQFQKADVLVFYQHGDWNAERAADIDAFLERGGGLVYIHWAVDGGNATAASSPSGSAWPPAAPIAFRHGPLDLAFNRDDEAPDHPQLRHGSTSTTKATGSWPATCRRTACSARRVEDGQPQPLFWTLEHGKGRVFVSIPGHYSWTFDDPLFRVLLLRGIAWTAHEPVDRFNDLVWPGPTWRSKWSSVPRLGQNGRAI